MQVGFLVTQIFSCFFLTGLIWTIQLVHYPFFQFTDVNQWLQAHAFHSARISIIVVPVMLLELGSAVILCHQKPFFWTYLNLFFVLGIWGSTFFLSVPLHNKLGLSFDATMIAALVATNWVRTLLWTARSAGLIYYLVGKV